MCRQHLIAMTIACAILALATAPGGAQTLSVGGINISLGDSNGTTAEGTVDSGSGTPAATADAEGGSLGGGDGPTTADASVGDTTTDADATASLGGASSGSPDAETTVILGSGAAGSTSGAVDASPGGATDGSADAEAPLTLGTGATDPVTGSVTTGGGTGSSGNTIGQLAVLTDSQLRSAVGRLADNDRLRLKRACDEVLANPSVYSRDTVAVCNVIASI